MVALFRSGQHQLAFVSSAREGVRKFLVRVGAAATALKVITWFEETVEPDPMLNRFHDWLQLKVDDPTAVLARWWISEFRETQEENFPYTGPSLTLH